MDAARGVAVFLESGFAEEEVSTLRRLDEVVAFVAVAGIRDDLAGRVGDPQCVGLDRVVDEEGFDGQRSDLMPTAVVDVGEFEGVVEVRVVSPVGDRGLAGIRVVGPEQPFLRTGRSEHRGAGADRAGVGDVAVEELRVEAVFDVQTGHVHAVVRVEVAEHDPGEAIGVDRLLQGAERTGSEVEDDASGCVLIGFDEVAAGEGAASREGAGGADSGEFHSPSSPCVWSSKVVVSRS